MRAFSCLLAFVALGCSPELPDEFACDETCDKSGPLQLSDRWVPEGGFVRATVNGDLSLKVTPQVGSTIEERDNGRFIVRFSEPGYYQVAAGRGVLGVRVADEGPTIELDPIGNDGLAGTGNIEIAGTVKEPLSGKTTLSLHGKKISVSSKGRFSTIVDADFGLTILPFELVDQVGNRFQEPKSFIGADDYGYDGGALTFRISPTAADDLAVELGAGLPSLLSEEGPTDPVYESFSADIYLDTFQYPDEVAVELIPAAGRLRVKISLSKPVVVRGRLDMLFDSTFRAELEGLSIDGYLRFSQEAGYRLDAHVEDVVVRSSGLDIDESSIIPDNLIEWLVGNVDDHVAEAINDELPAILSSTVASAAGSFDVNVPNQSGDLQGVYKLKDLRFDSEGAEVELGASVEMPSYQGAGAPRKSYGSPPVPKSEDAVFIDLNLLNKYLFALWRADGFTYTADESDLERKLGSIKSLAALDPIIDIKIESSMPPVATTGPEGAYLSLGEVQVTVSVSTEFFQVVAPGTFSGKARVEGHIDDRGLKVGAVLEEVHVDIDQVAFAGLDTERLEAMVEAVAPELFSDWASKLRVIELPTFDLESSGRKGRYFGLETAEAKVVEEGILFSGFANAYSF